MIAPRIIRRIRYKLAKRQYKRDIANNGLSDIQNNVIAIYKRLLSRYDSEMVVAPISGKKFLKWRDITAIEDVMPLYEGNTIFRKVHNGLNSYHYYVGKLPRRGYVPIVCVGQLLLALRKQGLIITEEHNEQASKKE